MTDDEYGKYVKLFDQPVRRQIEMKWLPIVAELTEQDLDRALGRETFEARMIRLASFGRPPAIISGGVPLDADARQIFDNAVAQLEPEGDVAAKLTYWREVSKWAPTAVEYERAEAMIAGLLAGTVPADRKAAEVVEPQEPIVKTRRVLVKTVLARDSAGDILKVMEQHVDIPIDEPPLIDPTRLLAKSSPPLLASS